LSVTPRVDPYLVLIVARPLEPDLLLELVAAVVDRLELRGQVDVDPLVTLGAPLRVCPRASLPHVKHRCGDSLRVVVVRAAHLQQAHPPYALELGPDADVSSPVRVNTRRLGARTGRELAEVCVCVALYL